MCRMYLSRIGGRAQGALFRRQTGPGAYQVYRTGFHRCELWEGAKRRGE